METDSESYSSVFRDDSPLPLTTVTHSVFSLAILVSATQLALQLRKTPVLLNVLFQQKSISPKCSTEGETMLEMMANVAAEQFILESRVYRVEKMLSNGEDTDLKPMLE